MIKLKTLITKDIKKRYSGIELDSESHDRLKEKFAKYIPEGWKVIAHHMTIDPSKTLPEEEIGKEAKLKVTHIGKNDKAMAVKVSGYEGKTNNKFPHVTLAVNDKAGGKPKDSNEITEWDDVKEDIYLTGIINNL